MQNKLRMKISTFTKFNIFFIIFYLTSNNENFNKIFAQNINEEWLVANVINQKRGDIKINGNPKIVRSPYGKAVDFNGMDDAIFLKDTPLSSLKEFTIEMIFKPETDAPFEQRILHFGEISGDRILLEIRAINGNWYFDGFAASGENKLALIDENLIHPLGQWYHVAFVVTAHSLTTYVNGKQELKKPYSFKPMNSGKSSIGVRLNKVSWFKGTVYKIRITPKELKPDAFLAF